MTELPDKGIHGSSTWTRLRNQERHYGRESHWFYSAWSPPDDDDDVLLRSSQSWVTTFDASRQKNTDISPMLSANEVQIWTVYLPPEDVEPFAERAGLRDYVVENLGRLMGQHCAYLGVFTTEVEIDHGKMEIRVTDLGLKHGRREAHCRAASLALLGMARVTRGQFRSKAFALVARYVWPQHVQSERWDRIFDSNSAQRLNSGATRAKKMKVKVF